MDENLLTINKRFNYILGEINAIYHDISLKLGLSDSAMQILYAICDMGEGCLLRDICRHSGHSKQTINSALRKLEQDNIIILDKTDTRYKTVRLTDTGRKLADKTANRIIEMENSIFASWTKEEVNNYLNLTQKYLNNLEDMAPTL